MLRGGGATPRLTPHHPLLLPAERERRRGRCATRIHGRAGDRAVEGVPATLVTPHLPPP